MSRNVLLLFFHISLHINLRILRYTNKFYNWKQQCLLLIFSRKVFEGYWKDLWNRGFFLLLMFEIMGDIIINGNLLCWILNSILCLFSQKSTVGLFECRLLLTREMGVMDWRTDPWRPWLHGGHQEICSSKKLDWEICTNESQSQKERRELLHVLLWNYFESAKLGRCKLKRRVTWNNKAWHTAAAAAAAAPHGTQANRQTDRQDKRKKVEKKGASLRTC
jgi:hypothetical protein